MRELTYIELCEAGAGVDMFGVWTSAVSHGGAGMGLGAGLGAFAGPGGALVGGLIGFGGGTIMGTVRAMMR
ncbi:hypothetical protein [Microbulbifer magnicolonia]|uniref:hypothetical protein n=1 Tax=Microbulbifer magnicolonia TaxID=3109744 RepID=UPI002B407D04|nr:hypothetical protein [Microbulbifer sp. GG15]